MCNAPRGSTSATYQNAKALRASRRSRAVPWGRHGTGMGARQYCCNCPLCWEWRELHNAKVRATWGRSNAASDRADDAFESLLEDIEASFEALAKKRLSRMGWN